MQFTVEVTAQRNTVTYTGESQHEEIQLRNSVNKNNSQHKLSNALHYNLVYFYLYEVLTDSVETYLDI